MQDPTPIPAAEPKAKTLYAFFRDLFSRMAIGQCVHAALLWEFLPKPRTRAYL